MEEPNQDKSRDEEIREVYKNERYRFFYRMLFSGLIILLLLLLGGELFSENHLDYNLSLFTNLIAIAIGVLFIDERAEHRAKMQLKQQLIRQMRFGTNELALMAVEEIRENRWHNDGSLKKARLDNARLMNAKLIGFDLEGACLNGAILEKADLTDANLKNSTLYNAQLQNASFIRADLQGAKLIKCQLQETDFSCSNLAGADLWSSTYDHTDFSDANLLNVKHFHPQATVIMPDGVEYSWHFEYPDFSPIQRFVNPDYPGDRWYSSEPKSPVYKGKDI